MNVYARYSIVQSISPQIKWASAGSSTMQPGTAKRLYHNWKLYGVGFDAIVWQNAGPSVTPTPTPTPDTNTPGRVRHLPKVKGVERETGAEKLARRIREGTLQAPVVPAPDDSAYFKESARLATAIAAARRDAEASRQAIALYEQQAQLQRQSEVVQAKLLRAEQALLLAKVQEAVLIEEMEVIDVAFLAHVALKVTLQ